jgi:hypothetical protein
VYRYRFKHCSHIKVMLYFVTFTVILFAVVTVCTQTCPSDYPLLRLSRFDSDFAVLLC